MPCPPNPWRSAPAPIARRDSTIEMLVRWVRK